MSSWFVSGRTLTAWQRLLTLGDFFVSAGVILSICGGASPVEAAFIYRTDGHATSVAHVGGVLDVNNGQFFAESTAHNFLTDSPFFEGAIASAASASAFGGFELKAYASSSDRDNSPNVGIAASTADAHAFWRERVFVQASGDGPPSIQLSYSLGGFLEALPLGYESTPFTGARAAGYIVVSSGTIRVAEDSEEISVLSPVGGTQHASLTGFFTLPLLSTGTPGEYYCDLDFELGSLVQQTSGFSNTSLNYDVTSDFSHTFYLTGATANGMSLEEAGITLQFQSQLERAALAELPEPTSLATFGFGVLVFVGVALRRRRS